MIMRVITIKGCSQRNYLQLRKNDFNFLREFTMCIVCIFYFILLVQLNDIN
jgi:hypothetical protein